MQCNVKSFQRTRLTGWPGWHRSPFPQPSRHQLTLPDHGYRASASCSVPDYVPVIAGTHCTYPWRDGQAELTWVLAGWLTHLPIQVLTVDEHNTVTTTTLHSTSHCFRHYNRQSTKVVQRLWQPSCISMVFLITSAIISLLYFNLIHLVVRIPVVWNL